MGVFLYTIHAYRSWMPDHKHGFVIRGRGIQKPDAKRARWYQSLAKHERMVFDDARCEQIIGAVKDVCANKQWRLHGVVVVWSHLHVIVSWSQYVDAKRARAVIKKAITTWLRDATGEQRKGLSGGGSIKRVRDRGHYEHLMKVYLPGHRKYGGAQYYEEPRLGRRG
ncbi:MAG: hypothetical protein ACYC26_07360 [Phycisphaerales bacterium]